MLIKQLDETKCVFELSEKDYTIDEIINNSVAELYDKSDLCIDCGYCWNKNYDEYFNI